MIKKSAYLSRDRRFKFKLWSRRVSNPRPNDEKSSFLHAYSSVNFRCNLGQRHPIITLIFSISNQLRSVTDPILKEFILLDPYLSSGGVGEGTCRRTILPLD